MGYGDGCCYVYSIQVGVRAWLGVKVGACALLGEKGKGGEGRGEMGEGRGRHDLGFGVWGLGFRYTETAPSERKYIQSP